ncbi:MAG: adenosylcobinamide amidohydrolase [Candidatus Methanomethylophilaceae archaeon]|nr:adenosylcobinamide amidohydrolase [Candidatus Methanomethylophilaceae archaeon]
MSMIGSYEVVDFEGTPVGVVRFKERMDVLSSAVLNGGLSTASAYFIMQVPKNYMTDDPRSDAERVRVGLGLPEDTVGMMTAAEVDYVFNVKVGVHDGLEVEAIATAGLSNHIVAGEELEDWEGRFRISQGRAARMMAGTINIAIVSPIPLSVAGMVNLMIPLVEAKSAAMSDRGFRETGTSSDSMAVFSPIGEGRADYAGTASSVGIAGARAVRAAVGHALATRFEHPVPEDANRVMDRLGLRSILVDEHGEERTGEMLSEDSTRMAVDIMYHLSRRTDSLIGDGNECVAGMTRDIIRSVTDGEPGMGSGTMEMLTLAISDIMRRKNVD